MDDPRIGITHRKNREWDEAEMEQVTCPRCGYGFKTTISETVECPRCVEIIEPLILEGGSNG